MSDNKGSDVLRSIDERLQQLEKQRNEMEKKYNIDENILTSFSFSEKTIQFPSEINKRIPKMPKPIKKELTKIDQEIIIEDKKKNQYKTPSKLIDSLKYEPNIYDLYSKEEFEPTYTNLNKLKSNPIIPQDYDCTNFINDNINHNYFENIIH